MSSFATARPAAVRAQIDRGVRDARAEQAAERINAAIRERELHDLRVIRNEHRRTLLAAYRASLERRDTWWGWLILGIGLGASIMVTVVAVAL